MAQAPGDPDERDLEQRILQALRDAGSPIKSIQLVKECQVPKKKLNQVLYRLMKESKVSQEGPATWALGTGRTGRVVPAEPAQANQAGRCQQDIVAVPEEPGLQLTDQQEAIYRFLEAHGPCKALNIAKGVGKKIAKDVNRDLYDMRKQHKLDFDEKTSTWAIYQPGAESRSHVPHDRDQASPGNGNNFTEFISHLEAVTLESRGPQAAEAGGRVDRTADEDPQGQGESRTSSQALSGGEDEHQ